MGKHLKETIVVSAVNFSGGGPLTILRDCLTYLSENLSQTYHIIALVRKEELVADIPNISYMSFPKAKESYRYRFYYEYVYFKRLSRRWRPLLWLSLHDMSPRVKAKRQAVYCHNPAPFYEITDQEADFDPVMKRFCQYYKYIYRINIHSNDFVIVQQDWLRQEFIGRYGLKQSEVVVALPNVKAAPEIPHKELIDKKLFNFFYASFPRVFKNFEIIAKAVQELNKRGIQGFKAYLTIDGSENAYAKYLVDAYRTVDNLEFVGLLPREEVFSYYQQSDCLIFPSKLETWGLPVSEYKAFDKPILLADARYARETAGDYDKIARFDPYDARQLAELMQAAINNTLQYEQTKAHQYDAPYSESWAELFDLLLASK